MRLSERSRRVLNAVRGRGGIGVPALAKHLEMRPATVRYELQKLQDLEILADNVALINVRALGFFVYNLYLAVQYATQEDKRRFYAAISSHQAVTWFSEVGGNYQLCILVQVRTTHGVKELLSYLEQIKGTSIGDKLASRCLSFSVIPFDSCRLDEIAHANTPESTGLRLSDLDPTTRSILKFYCAPNPLSNREIAKYLGSSPASVDRRVRRLRELNIIVGYFWRLHYRESQLSKYKLLVSVRDHSSQFCHELLRFCAEREGTSHFKECLGSWDYEVSVEVFTPGEAADFSSAFQSRFGVKLSRVDCIPVLGFGAFRPVSPEFLDFLECE